MKTVASGTAAPQTALGALRRLDRLVGPYGLVNRVQRLPNHPGEPRFPIYTASLGDIAAIAPNVAESTAEAGARGAMDGAGGSLRHERAMRLSVAEALERYSTCQAPERDFIWATATELGEDTVRLLGAFPRCSATELAHPKAMATDIDVDAPMRWVRGWSLTQGTPVWVPAVHVWMHLSPKSAGERHWNPISTGSATHSGLAQALVNALCEVIERDAIALTWYQRLPLPRVEFDVVPDDLLRYLQRARNSHVRTMVFDATSDIGVPTLYAIDLSPHNEVLGQMVMCSAGLDPVDVTAKVLRESASSRIAMQVPRQRPGSVDDYLHVFHGAAHMGEPARLSDFGFLLNGSARRPFSELANLATGDPGRDLRLLLDMVRAAGAQVIAVECTTAEAREVGFRVVRVLVPELMPLSFTHRARYLAHPRLYSAPTRMGYRSYPEQQINPLPQPFA
jgi:ribosomal protein S12 methylthiotransferase accessory factor